MITNQKMIAPKYTANATGQAKPQWLQLARTCGILVFLAVTVLALGQSSLGAEAAVKPVVIPLRLRGFMVDPPRTPESMDYYKRLVAFSADWGFNALVFRLTDDQGAAIRFESHPEFFTHKNALSTAQVRELVAYAQQRGVELIPEIESFGHTKFITAVEQYADLRDHDPKNVDKRSSTFSAVIPSHPKVLKLFEDIYRETANLFPSRYLHGGCDEVAWGDSEFTKAALKTKSRAQVWGQYINDLNALARKNSKEFIVWADHPLNEDPAILNYLDKNIILMDWDYSRTDPKVVETAARKVLENGSRVIGAPSLIHCKWGPRAGVGQLRNIDAYADAYRAVDDPRNLGVVVTNWVPSRYIQDSIWDGVAYAGVALKEGSAVARRDAFRLFIEKHYGSVWNENWADIFDSYYAAAPDRPGCAPAWTWPKLPAAWHTREELAQVLNSSSTYAPPFTRILSLLNFAEPLVRRNLSDFRAFRLSLRYLEELFWRNTVLVQELSASGRTRESSTDLIRAIAERDRLLYDELSADWDRGRPSDSTLKLQDIYGVPGEQLVFDFGRAASFSRELAEKPDLFLSLLDQAKPHAFSPEPSSPLLAGMQQACR